MPVKEQEFISLNSDLLFKETFSHPHNKKYLIYLLSCFLNIDYNYLLNRKISVNNELIFTKTKYREKACRADIVIGFDDYIINIESYSSFNNNSFLKSTNYLMRLFILQTPIGEKRYQNNKKIIQLNFIDNPQIKLPKKIETTYVNYENLNDKRLKDQFKMEYLRIDKAREISYNEANKKVIWLKFIGAKSYEERKEIAKGDELLMELNEWMEKYVNDEQALKFYDDWNKELARESYREECIKIGEKKGIKIGHEQGKEEANLITAKKMLEDTVEIPTIAKYTGLSIKEIQALKAH